MLWDPHWGNILDLNTGQKLTHGGTGINCRCACEVRVEFDVMQLEPVVDLKDLLKLMV